MSNVPSSVSPPRLWAASAGEFRPTTGRRISITRFTLGFLSVALVSAAAWPFLPRHYESFATVVLVPNEGDEGTAAVRLPKAVPDDNETQSDVDMISSPILAATVVAKNQLMNDPEFASPGLLSQVARSIPILVKLLAPEMPVTTESVRMELQRHLEVARDRRSYTVQFGFWSSDPRKAAALTRSLLEAYGAMRADRKRAAIRRITGWLEDRVAVLRRESERSHEAVRVFMDKTGLIDAGAQTSLESQLATLSADLAQVNSKEIEAATRARMLEAMSAAKTVQNAPDVLASPSIQKLKEAMSAAMAKPGAWAPEAKEIASQIAAESDRIVAGAAAEARAWTERGALLKADLASIRVDLTKRARARTRLDDLLREAKADEAVLAESLVRLRGQTSMTLAIAPDIDVIALPEPAQRPAFPNALLAMAGTLFAGSMCGAFLAKRGSILPTLVSWTSFRPQEAAAAMEPNS